MNIENANGLGVTLNEWHATIPLLPPPLRCKQEQPRSSPLQPPSTSSLSATPRSVSPANLYIGPITPMKFSDPEDKWATLLGHQDFTILPEPYVPRVHNSHSVKLLVECWQRARDNYAKHRVRTAESFSVTSRYFLMAEMKWTEVEAEWRTNYELVKSRAKAISQELVPHALPRPESCIYQPSLGYQTSQGKFPNRGDEDIVGPMLQYTRSSEMTSRKGAFGTKMMLRWLNLSSYMPLNLPTTHSLRSPLKSCHR